MSIEFDEANAAHLLRRAGFGPRPKEVAKRAAKGLESTVEWLLESKTKGDFVDVDGKSLPDLQAFWVRRMVKAKNPLAEKMALFWHDYFATAISKVGSLEMMAGHLARLRKKPLGKFRKILKRMVKDGALIVWLDSQENKKDEPNENLARELMELFTTGVANAAGEPNYTEQDVAEAARALTGWAQERGDFLFIPEYHDFGVKTIKGVTGKLDGFDLLDLLVEDPATPRRIAWELFRFFAYDVELDDPVLDPMVAAWHENDTSIKAMLGVLFRMDAFYSDEAKQSRVKNPAEFMAGALRQLRAKVKNGKAFNQDVAAAMRSLGQDLLNPPSVFGWPEGLGWTTSDGVLQRLRVAEQIADARAELGSPVKWKGTKLLGKKKEWPLLDAAAVVDLVLAALSVSDMQPASRADLIAYLETAPDGSSAPFFLDPESFDSKVRGLVALVLASPEYQLS